MQPNQCNQNGFVVYGLHSPHSYLDNKKNTEVDLSVSFILQVMWRKEYVWEALWEAAVRYSWFVQIIRFSKKLIKIKFHQVKTIPWIIPSEMHGVPDYILQPEASLIPEPHGCAV